MKDCHNRSRLIIGSRSGQLQVVTIATVTVEHIVTVVHTVTVVTSYCDGSAYYDIRGYSVTNVYCDSKYYSVLYCLIYDYTPTQLRDYYIGA